MDDESNAKRIQKLIEQTRKQYAKKQDPFTKLKLGRLYLEDKNFPKARKIFEDLKVSEITVIRESANLELSKLDIKEKNYEDAKSHLSEVGFKKRSEANELNARIERKNGSYDVARQKYMHLIKNTKNPIMIYELGILEYRNNNIEGIKTCIDMLHTIKDEVQAIRLQVVLDLYNDDREDAKRNLEKLLDTTYDQDAKLMLGTMYLSESNHALALKYFEELLSTKSRYQAMARIAKIKDLEGFHDEAYNDYLSVIDRIKDEYIFIDFARCLCHLGKFDEALSYLDKVKNSEDKETALNKKIYILIHQDRFEEAMKLFKDNYKLSQCASGLPWFYTYVNLFPHKEINIEELSYSCKQCYKYKTKRAINHIKEHLTKEESGEIHTLFYDNLDIDSLYFDIREKIHDMNFVYKEFSDQYIVNAGYKVGNVHGYETEYVTVITIPGTKSILTMYPVVVTDRFRELDRDVK